MTTPHSWLAAISRRVLHHDTFDMMVSPALADLEAEAFQGWRQRARHYAGFPVVLGCALLRDTRADAGLTSFASTWQTWRKAVLWHFALAIPVATVIAWATPWRHLEGVELVILAMFIGAIFGTPVSTTAAAFYLRRSGVTEARAVVTALVVPLVLSAPMYVIWSGFGPSATLLVYKTAAPRIQAARKPVENTLEHMWLSYFDPQRAEKAKPPSVWDTVRDITAFPLSPLMGVWLARRRGWRIFSSFFALQCAFLGLSVARLLMNLPGLPVTNVLAIMLSLLGPGIVWLLVLRGSTRHPAAAAALVR